MLEDNSDLLNVPSKSPHRNSNLRSIVFLLLGLIVLYLIFRNQQNAYLEDCALKGIPEADCSLLAKLAADFKSTRLGYLFLVMFLFLSSCVLRAVRWQMMMEPLSPKTKWYNSLGAIMIAYLANLAFPRVGEFVRAGVISRFEKISTSQAMGTIIIDRLIDVICLGLVLGAGFLLAYGDIIGYFRENLSIADKIPALRIGPVFISSFLVLIALCAYIFIKFKSKILANPLVKRITLIVKSLLEGMLSVRKLRSPSWFIVQSISIWVLFFLMNFAMFKAFEPTMHLGLKPALVVFIFGSLGILFPSPGGMGSYHFLVMQSLAIYGISGPDAFSFAMIAFFTIQIFTIVFFGLLFYTLLPILNKRSIPNTKSVVS
jgi:glycosyltransferase 2 family protein